jgi:hypothetical protein
MEDFMKRIILIGCLIIVSILSCFILVKCCWEDPLADVDVGEMHDYKFDDSEIPELKTINEIAFFILDHTTSDANNDRINHGVDDYWQLPEESYKLKVVDCEDIDLFFMYLLKTRLNIDSNMLMIRSGNNRHTLVQINENDYVDLSMGDRKDSLEKLHPGWGIIFTIPYPEAIWMTYYYHDNVGKYR